ncbi:FecR family protein [Sinomicrobium soli]|uniref:FecR family protein n=1 Tax=Sinomicrobium sp. N-1-3-6 TaxID=2219864 RepID=UPI000DCE9C45|nr:FecR family protein [Sinomicrobium sp. N-1-3-6]RAV29642.1 hypothetical protein DN748_05845 [Sinomicrobium sp. N-1-3-6]
MPEQHFSYLIQQFFLDKISEKELSELDQLLKTDETSREEFAAYARLHHKLSGMAYSPKGNKKKEALFQSVLQKINSGESLDPDKDNFRTAKAPHRETEEVKTGRYRSARSIARRRFIYGLAASVVVLIGITFFYRTFQTPPSIEKYSKFKLQSPSHEGDVRLIVDGEEIDINEANPVISYSESGERIDINEKQAVHQKTVDKDNYNTVVVPYGKRSSVLLADGTKVWLNSGSVLTYPSRFSKKRREVYLEGQAVFDVSHDAKKPFYVLSAGQVVKVLGTIFDVRSYPDEDFSRTVLKSGSVEITYPEVSTEHSTVRITPNTLAMFDKTSGDVARMDVDADSYMSWREGVFVFENEKVEEIAKTISRYYGVEIELDGEFENITTYSGKLDMKASLEDVLDIIKGSLYFDYRRESGKIILTN